MKEKGNEVTRMGKKNANTNARMEEEEEEEFVEDGGRKGENLNPKK